MKKVILSVIFAFVLANVANAQQSANLDFDPAQKMTDIYKTEFNLKLPYPVVVEYSSNEQAAFDFRYFSTAWINNTLYIIRLRNNGTYKVEKKPNKGFIPNPPKGELKTAVISIDFHNTNLTDVYPTEVVKYTSMINAIHTNYAKSLKLDKPIIQYKMEYFLADGVSYQARKDVETWAKTFLNIQGTNFDDYDLIVLLQLNLSAGGYCCWGDKSQLVMQGNQFSALPYLDWTTADGQYKLKYIIRSAFLHEGGHFHGWDHDWPDSSNDDFITTPSLYGWTDTDGDGVVEILDSTPYGMGSATGTNDEIIIQNQTKVFPNPSSNGFFNLSNAAQSIIIRNYLGSIIFNLQNADNINLSTQPKGIYFAEIINRDQVVVQKLVVN